MERSTIEWIVMVIVALWILIILCSCATMPEPRPWTTGEKKLLAVSCVAAAADMYTTIRCLDNDLNYEINPVMGKYPSDSQVISYMVSTQALAVVISHYWPDSRKWLLGSKVLVNTVGACNNTTLDW